MVFPWPSLEAGHHFPPHLRSTRAARSRNDYSVGTFRDILSNLGHWVDDETWHVEDGDVITQKQGPAFLGGPFFRAGSLVE